MMLTVDASTPASSSAASRLKCAVDANGVATVLPSRSAIVVMSGVATRDSAAPITSKIHGTVYSMPVDSPRDAGLLPTRPMSTAPAITASLTSPPESNSFHSMLTSGPNASSSQPWFFTMRSPFGTCW